MKKTLLFLSLLIASCGAVTTAPTSQPQASKVISHIDTLGLRISENNRLADRIGAVAVTEHSIILSQQKEINLARAIANHKYSSKEEYNRIVHKCNKQHAISDSLTDHLNNLIGDKAK